MWIFVNIVSDQGIEEIYFPQIKSHLIDDGSLYLNNFPTTRLTQIDEQILLHLNGIRKLLNKIMQALNTFGFNVCQRRRNLN